MTKLIRGVYESLKVTEIEHNKTQNNIKKMINTAIRHSGLRDLKYEVLFFGSCDNGFFSKLSSDFDVTVVLEDFTFSQKAALYTLSDSLRRQCRSDGEVTLIRPKRSPPLIRFMHVAIQSKVEILVNNAIPVFNTEMIKFYCKFDERFKRLGLFLKYWYSKKLKDCFNSYAIILKLLVFLQTRTPPVLPKLQRLYKNKEEKEKGDYIYHPDMKIHDNRAQCQEIPLFNMFFQRDQSIIAESMKELNNQSEGELLCEYFLCYGYTFNEWEMEINVPEGKFLKKNTDEMEIEPAFSIIDPFDGSNLGRKVPLNSMMHKRLLDVYEQTLVDIMNSDSLFTEDEYKELNALYYK